jgi:hypothetical protein
VLMPAIASLEDLKSAQRGRLSIYAMLYALSSLLLFWRWRRIGWKNICKLWLEESTPEKLKGEGG